MKSILKPVLAAGIAFAAVSPLVAVPASAQVALKGIGVIDPNVVINGSAAFKAAEAQRPQTYQQYYQQAKTRKDQIDAQLEPLIKKFDADRAVATPNREDLSKQAAAINQIDQQGERELQQILAPVALSQQYVDEQINEALSKAIENAATKKQITLILNRATGAVVYRDAAYNINQDVIAELDAILPVAQIVPPPNWLPRELREQLARQQAAAGAQPGAVQPGAAPAATPSTPAGPPAESR
ncbi:MAG TPA: OmpH family outer membrane protein [Sphingomonadaceae bacterium]|nr:OmpH family outer membrane protein [Sphingomonadaceae bacterium]